ncbi:MAG: bifunctional 4-hydroxy-3-methylbut-2-enyl diphosphate reductase/30S ribosomal protein S1 [Syntrophomonadaceae bacterium]|jgi:4-hydroxy-3-methylbut-2-enyl diphosphate reductase|nr:bifunctional 4-hydroxy-3-methylbut-2-enyl diphosphate reductase/30S ribosomal protein S1 [Syntrophomonadaceae bacterium]
MHTIMASHAGFCAGVKRAFKIAEEMAGQPSKWYTWGPLVHNQSVVEYFARQGISAVEDIDEISEPAGLIIRSHGVAPEIIQEAENCGLQVRDATCPLVKRVHEIVQVLADQGYEIVIYGNPEHPEVKGIQGWCGGQAAVVSGLDDIKTLNHSHRMGIVSQTTRDEKEYFEVVKSLLGRTEELKVFNTICSATQLRQNSALELCQQVDLMIVVGGEFSSNTTTLYKECLNTGVRTYLVQNAGDINPHWLEGVKMAGITAGASTPDWIIKEVLCRMTEYEEKDIQQEDIQQEVQDQIEEQTQEPVQEPVFEPQQEEPGSNEQPAEEANEESFARMEAEMAEYETPGRGDVIKGTIVQVLDDEVMVDVGGKSEGVVPLRELSLATVDSARDLVQVGEEIEVMILKWDDDGTILLSKKRVDSKKVLDELEEVFEKGDTVQGTVKDIVKGGLIVDVGVVGFLPASHVEDGYVKNLEEYKDQTFAFKIIEFNRNKRRGSQVVLSRRELVLAEKQQQKQEFWDNIQEGQIRLGKVKRIVDYGAFIDLGGYEGLLHVSELDHKRIEHPADVLQEGDELEIFVLGVDTEKERVSLSRKKLLKSPWEVALETFQEGDIVDGTVVRIAPFGAFVELDPGVDGLVHISQLADYRVEKPEDVVSVNQPVKVKILSVDANEKRIGLSIKEAQREMEQEEVEEYMEQQE